MLTVDAGFLPLDERSSQVSFFLLAESEGRLLWELENPAFLTTVFSCFLCCHSLIYENSPIPKRAPFSLNLLSLPFSSSCISFTLPSLTLLASQPQFAAKVPLGHLRAWDTHPFWIRWILPLKRTIMVNSDLKTCRDVLTKRNRRKWQRLKKKSTKLDWEPGNW